MRQDTLETGQVSQPVDIFNEFEIAIHYPQIPGGEIRLDDGADQILLVVLSQTSVNRHYQIPGIRRRRVLST